MVVVPPPWGSAPSTTTIFPSRSRWAIGVLFAPRPADPRAAVDKGGIDGTGTREAEGDPTRIKLQGHVCDGQGVSFTQHRAHLDLEGLEEGSVGAGALNPSS